jgi:hypothetical protein
MRMADAIDDGRESGVVAAHGANQHEDVQTPDILQATLSDIGVSRQRLHEWRVLRDAGEPAAEAAIQSPQS